MNDDERDLIKKCLEGDRAAFGKLIQRYEDRLFETIRFMTGNDLSTEEIVQQTFLNAYQSLSTFKGDCPFYTWLYRIAVKVIIDMRRKQGKLTFGEHPVFDKKEHLKALDTLVARAETVDPRHRTDASLVAECQAGRASALRALLARYRIQLRQIVQELAATEPERVALGMRLAQMARQTIGEFNGDVPFITWMYQLAVRAARDQKT